MPKEKRVDIYKKPRGLPEEDFLKRAETFSSIRARQWTSVVILSTFAISIAATFFLIGAAGTKWISLPESVLDKLGIAAITEVGGAVVALITYMFRRQK